jgi:hypothetical protein
VASAGHTSSGAALGEVRPSLKFYDVTFGISGIDKVGNAFAWDRECNHCAAARTTRCENLRQRIGNIGNLKGEMPETNSVGSWLRAVKRLAVRIYFQCWTAVSKPWKAKMFPLDHRARYARATIEFCSRQLATWRHRGATKHRLIKTR